MNSASAGRFSVKKSGSPSKHQDKTNLIGADANDDEVVVVSPGGAGRAGESQYYGSVNGSRRKNSRKGTIK